MFGVSMESIRLAQVMPSGYSITLLVAMRFKTRLVFIRCGYPIKRHPRQIECVYHNGHRIKSDGFYDGKIV